MGSVSDPNQPIFVLRRGMLVRAGVVAAIIAALGLGIGIGVVLSSSSAPTHRGATHHQPAASTSTSSTLPVSTSTTPVSVAAPSSTTPANAPLPNFTAGSYNGRGPKQIDFSGGCCSVVDMLAWSSWTSASAQGSGSYEYDTCTNGCIQGPFVPYPATITLSNPEGNEFTVLTRDISGGPDAGVTTWTYPSMWPFSAS